MGRITAFLLILGLLLTGCSVGQGPPVLATLPAPTLISDVANAPAQLKIAVIVFLSGDAAEPFGHPAQSAAKAILDSLNRGQAPAPYNIPGIGGVRVTALYVDENGGSEKQAAEIRRLYVEEKVDIVIGYSSSGDCLAAAPVAEEVQKLLVIFDCGTSRLFEERSYRYVFRTNAHQAIDSLGGARYLLKLKALEAVDPDISRIAGINQNYSWGQDSWAHFRDTLAVLHPSIEIVSEQFPKLGARMYSGEIKALMAARPEFIHTSFWGGDLQRLIQEGNGTRLFIDSQMLMTVGESSIPLLGKSIPIGTIIGAHGPHGSLAPASPLNDWLIQIYRQHSPLRPTYPVYHMAQAILGIKMAYENTLVKTGSWPSIEQVIDTFEYMSYPTPSGEISLAIGSGHQAVEPAVFGAVKNYDPEAGEVILDQIITFPAACVNPPEGWTTEQWIREGFPGNDCP